MSKECSDNCIKVAVPLAIGAAVIPIPIADALAISSIQVGMIVAISKCYGRFLDQNTIKGLMGAFAGSTVGLWAWSLIKTIPGLGTTAGIIGQMILAGTITAAIGYAFQYVYENQLELNHKNLKDGFNKNKRRAKEEAQQYQNVAKKTKDAKEIVNFRLNPENVSTIIDFSFNISNYGNATLTIVDNSNNVIKTVEITSSQTDLTLDLSDVPAGSYLAKLTINGLLPYFHPIKKI